MHLLSACAAALTTSAWALVASCVAGPTMVAGAVLAGMAGAVALLCTDTAGDVDVLQAVGVAGVLVVYQTNLWWAFALNGPHVQAIVNMNVVVIAAACLLRGTVHLMGQQAVATAAAATMYIMLGLYVAYTPTDSTSARSPNE
jgi:hypothetical protein